MTTDVHPASRQRDDLIEPPERTRNVAMHSPDLLMLREELEEITDVREVGLHHALLAAIDIGYPHSINLQRSPHPIDRYTCLVHVLDFTERPEYVAIASYGLGRVFAGEDFAHWLLAYELLSEVADSDASNGDIVFYLDAQRFAHAGLWLSNNRVVSKWGTGHLLEHALFEVPASYGSAVRFFRRMAYEEAYSHFVRFAQANGIRVNG